MNMQIPNVHFIRDFVFLNGSKEQYKSIKVNNKHCWLS